jgi:hypothetical protein
MEIHAINLLFKAYLNCTPTMEDGGYLLMSYIHTYVIIQNAGFDNIIKSTDYMNNVMNLPMTEYIRYHESPNVIL